jgi:GTP cyclohydrolase I
MAPVVALLDKRPSDSPYHGKWVVFPWEQGDAGAPETMEDNVRRILQTVEPDTYERGGLDETPARVAKAWKFWTKGYAEDPASILKTFEDGSEGCNEMVLVRDIPVYSHCEHHLAAIFGKATVAYIPDGKIVGLSKLNRVVDCFARRLQVQERLTNQIADAIHEHLEPKGVGVIVSARHMCMESRGVCQQGHDTVTSALRGVMLEGTPRAEFLALARK